MIEKSMRSGYMPFGVWAQRCQSQMSYVGFPPEGVIRTYTPVMGSLLQGWTLSAVGTNGTFMRVGNLVWVSITVTWTDYGSDAAGGDGEIVNVSLPVPVASAPANHEYNLNYGRSTGIDIGNYPTVAIYSGQPQADLMFVTDAGVSDFITQAGTGDGSTSTAGIIHLTGVYPAD